MPNTSKIILSHGFKYDPNKTPSSTRFTVYTYLLLLEVESLFLSFLEEAELEVVTTEATIPFEAEDKK